MKFHHLILICAACTVSAALNCYSDPADYRIAELAVILFGDAWILLTWRGTCSKVTRYE